MKYPTVQWAEQSPDHPILFDGAEVITHAGLEERIVAAAKRLRALGVAPEARVALWAANSAEWITIAHAVTRVGAILVPLNTRLSVLEIREQLEYYSPQLIIADASLPFASADESFWRERAVRLGTPSDQTGQWWNQIPPAPARICTEVDPEHICTIVSTSGTTGSPKGVCLSLANHLAAAEASGRNLQNRTSDRWLINLPLFHVGGLSIVYRSAASGIGMVVHRRFGVFETIAAIANDGITHLSLVENMLARLLDEWGDRPFPGGLRGVLVGGGPVRLELLQEARRRGLPVLPTYGLTESASQVATLPLDASEDCLGTSGRPLPGCEVEIRDENDAAVPVGTKGQIWIRGPMVMRGYWNPRAPEPTNPYGSWCRTGDIGEMNAFGYLTVHGRADDMIVSGGEKFFPAEIEARLAKLPGVREAAVI
ncbi:MAG: AMP-binding protein, partial [candidate division Zixibacteria bacterium]|nr:AMP-binding protein [candidate division Zixibacteria bacterium]